MDVTDPEAVADAMDRAGGDGLDVLVNNAGTTTVQGTEDMPLDVWNNTLATNLTGS